MNGDIMRGGRDEAVVPSGAMGLTDTAGTTGCGTTTGIAEVSGAVTEWVEQVGRFLGVLQVALEHSRPNEDASAEVRALTGQLPALIRQCRAQVPTAEMIRTWVKSLTEGNLPQGVDVGVGDCEVPPRQPRAVVSAE